MRNNNKITKLLIHTDIQLLILHLIGICFHLNISLLNIDNIKKEVSRSNEDFIKEHSEKYTFPTLPPVWKTLEVASLGTLSKLFYLFKDNRLKKQVAREFGLPQYTYLESWIRCITVLRNCCAHHARIWNRRFALKPQLPNRLPLNWIAPSLKPIKLYHQLCTLL